MEIHNNDYRPVDPATRRRQTEAASARSGAPVVTPSGQTDQVDVTSSSPAAIARYVQLLKDMNPVDLHKIDQLRQRIAEGSYSASADEMAGPLAELLGGGGSSSRVTPKSKA